MTVLISLVPFIIATFLWSVLRSEMIYLFIKLCTLFQVSSASIVTGYELNYGIRFPAVTSILVFTTTFRLALGTGCSFPESKVVGA